MKQPAVVNAVWQARATLQRQKIILGALVVAFSSGCHDEARLRSERLAGYQSGVATAQQDWYDRGRNEGFKDGWGAGLQAGYDQGLKQGRWDFIHENKLTALGWGFFVGIVGLVAPGVWVVLRQPIAERVHFAARTIAARREQQQAQQRVDRALQSLAEREGLRAKLKAAEAIAQLRQSGEFKERMEEEIVEAWRERLVADFHSFWQAGAQREADRLRELINEICANARLTPEDRAELFKRIKPETTTSPAT